jgi:hypothetical protein
MRSEKEMTMKARHIALVALAAAVTLASVAAAGTGAVKERVAITMKGLPDGTFVLTPLREGAVARDSGTVNVAFSSPRVVMRNGQRIEVFRPTFTFEGKRGSVTIRERNEWVQTGNAAVATGTWKVVRGTGEYATVAGAGRSAHVGHKGGHGAWYARQEGFFSLR